MINKLVKESEYFIAWLLYWLCSAIGAVTLGTVIGDVVGAILGAEGVDLHKSKLISNGLAMLGGITVSYVMFRIFVAMMIVKKVEARTTPSNQPDAGNSQ